MRNTWAFNDPNATMLCVSWQALGVRAVVSINCTGGGISIVTEYEDVTGK
jgi:hypothetical protein